MPDYNKKMRPLESKLKLDNTLKDNITLFHGVFDPEALAKLELKPKANVFVCEGRPSLEAGLSTSKALIKKGLTPTVISDNMAGFLFFKGMVKTVVIACQYADTTGALGDIGALILAVLAKKHHVPIKLLPACRRERFLGDPKAILSFNKHRIAPVKTVGFVPMVEWVDAKYLI